MMEQGEPITIQTRDMTFAALAWGPEKAPIILALHGWLDNAATFTRLAPLLTGVRIISVDLAGHGHSDHRGSGADYPLWSNVPDVLAIADTLGLERIHLLGHSMGAIVSLMLAATVPERVASLTLIDGLWPGYSAPEATVDQLAKAVVWRSRPVQGMKKHFPSVAMAVEARQTGYGKISFEAAEIIVRRGLKADNEGWIWRSDPRLLAPTAMRMSMQQSKLLVAAVKAPTYLLVARGGLVDAGVGRFRDSLNHITISALDGDHHLHLEEQAGEVAQEIGPHLSAVLT